MGHLRVRKNQDTLFSFIVARFMAGEKTNTEQKQEIEKKKSTKQSSLQTAEKILLIFFTSRLPHQINEGIITV